MIVQWDPAADPSTALYECGNKEILHNDVVAMQNTDLKEILKELRKKIKTDQLGIQQPAWYENCFSCLCTSTSNSTPI